MSLPDHHEAVTAHADASDASERLGPSGLVADDQHRRFSEVGHLGGC
jgi:hypothetical protein